MKTTDAAFLQVSEVTTESTRRRRSRKWSRSEAQQYVATYRASGKGLAEFARAAGLSGCQLRNWSHRLKISAAPTPGAHAKVVLTEVQMPSAMKDVQQAWAEIFVGAEACVRVYPHSNEDAILRAVSILRKGAGQC